MNGISPAILATSAVASGVVAFAAGFLLGAPTSHAEARNSTIVDPEGVALATIGTGSDVAIARVRLDSIERVRRANPALELRRFTIAPR